MMFEKPDVPFSHHVFSRDPGTRRALKIYLKTILGACILISLTIWSILGIYWGANWRVYQGIHNLNAWIVDFDGGSIGSIVTQAYLNATGPQEQLSYYTVPASNFPNGESDIVNAVLNEECWLAVVISAGATDRLNAAIASGSDASFNNSAAVTIYAEEARNENSYIDFVMPLAEAIIKQTMPTFALQQVQQLGAERAGSLLSTAPMLVIEPLNYTVNDLRPFDIQVAEAVDFVGLIYLLILSFIAAMANTQARTMISGLENRLTLSSLIGLRLTVPCVIYFFLSLVYALLSLFFHVPFERKFGHAGFVVYWMLSWMGMLALGLAIEAMITLLTVRFIPFFLVPWIIVNVSVVFYPVEIMPTIFRYGYATPFYNVSRATRTILFSTRNQVGFNFGVLFAWIGVSLITIPLFQWHSRRKAIQMMKQKQAQQVQAADAASERTATRGGGDGNEDESKDSKVRVATTST